MLPLSTIALIGTCNLPADCTRSDWSTWLRSTEVLPVHLPSCVSPPSSPDALSLLFATRDCERNPFHFGWARVTSCCRQSQVNWLLSICILFICWVMFCLFCSTFIFFQVLFYGRREQSVDVLELHIQIKTELICSLSAAPTLSVVPICAAANGFLMMLTFLNFIFTL